MAAMLGLSGDFIGTLEGSAWFQRGWMVAVGLLLLGAHVAVEMLNTREDRLLAAELEKARVQREEAEDTVRRLDRERAELQGSVKALRTEAEVMKRRVGERAREQEGLDWLAGEQGRAALEGLRDFAERLNTAYRSADGGEDPPRPAEVRPRAAADPSPLRLTASRMVLQLVVGLLAAAVFGFTVYVVEVYFD
ncbi:hypothetical protein LG943_15515 [Streptomonospora sp. S1-112]|uniref:Uncharacterized protein n=1 Tax=Streptomonospora mangrovi TaxID=2883123 RepID=A0A9X3NP94_9ACTN|nr:hypothetical protein [Streptomonospora mangrovi]MDA0565711.1 hypothetical protein [Streptomonospora mangrovi]